MVEIIVEKILVEPPIKHCFYCGRIMQSKKNHNFDSDTVMNYSCPAWWLFHPKKSWRYIYDTQYINPRDRRGDEHWYPIIEDSSWS